MENLNLLIVFIEGVLSFFSPCILPLLPVYLGILSNSEIELLEKGETKFTKSSLFKNTLCFALGISVTFFILGASVHALGSVGGQHKELISLIGGLIIIFMGLFYADIIQVKALNREKRFRMRTTHINSFSALLLGFTFSFGWTPCIGPVLSSVLIMASVSKSGTAAYWLILVYTLGFILPFILIAAFYSKLYQRLHRIKKYMPLIKKIGGIILILSGGIMAINAGTELSKNQSSHQVQVEENKEIENLQESSQDKDEEEIAKEDEVLETDEVPKVKALDFTLYDQYGNKHTLSDYEGKTVFLNIWATWCPPCRGEMPHIEALYKAYGENTEEVIILGLAAPNLGSEGDEAYIKSFLEKEGYTFPVVMDTEWQQIYGYGINAFPTTLIIDPEGYINLYVPGAMDEATMKQIIENVY